MCYRTAMLDEQAKEIDSIELPSCRTADEMRQKTSAAEGGTRRLCTPIGTHVTNSAVWRWVRTICQPDLCWRCLVGEAAVRGLGRARCGADHARCGRNPSVACALPLHGAGLPPPPASRSSTLHKEEESSRPRPDALDRSALRISIVPRPFIRQGSIHT